MAELIMSTSQDLIPKIPLKPEDTELDFGFLADLALKIVYADTNCTTERAAEKLKLSMPVTEELLQHLYREKFVEIRGLLTYGNNRYGMLDRGWQRAQRLLDMNGYIGPAPGSPSDALRGDHHDAAPERRDRDDPTGSGAHGDVGTGAPRGHGSNPRTGGQLSPQSFHDRPFRQRQNDHCNRTA